MVSKNAQPVKCLRGLLRGVFGILDSDGDDQLSVDELLEASTGSSSGDVLTKVTGKFHELFPMRPTSTELEDFVKTVIDDSFGGDSQLDKKSISQGMKWIDDNEDGHIQCKEVGNYYNSAGKKFFEISKTIKQMGPMLAMFGGGMDMGGGSNGGGFKMDL